MQLLRKLFYLASIFFAVMHAALGQTGSITATFTPNNTTSKTVTFKFTKPVFKFNNSHGYWVTNPRYGSRHINIQPNAGYGNTDAAFISISESANDFDLYSGTSNDSTSINFSNALYSVSAPKYDVQNPEANKPMKVHIVSFTPSEIVFTIKGQANRLMRSGYDAKGENGTINATAHFYREAKYDKSDVLPGCNCDATIYATVFDEENNIRTTSDCENALSQKVFDAVQKAFSPVLSKLNDHSLTTRAINISMIAGHTNIDVPVYDRAYCSSVNYHNSLTGVHAHKKYFSSDEKYGIQLNRGVSNDALGVTGSQLDNSRRQMAIFDSLSKLLEAKKITMAQYTKMGTAALIKLNSGAPDIKKLEVENHLYIYIIVNPENTIFTDVKIADKNYTSIQHKIKGASFEIFSGQVKDSDDSWLANRYNIYFGKYTTPSKGKAGAGFDAINTKAIYPTNGNKLSVYNVVIKMEGAKDLMDAVISNIDFTALQNLIVN